MSTPASPVRVITIGGPDTGHVGAECRDPACYDINGRRWQRWHSRRTVEGRTLAERDAREHLAARHAQAASAQPPA